MKLDRHLIRLALAVMVLGNSSATLRAAEDWSLTETKGQYVDLTRDGVTLARLMTAHDVSSAESQLETYKPYLHVFDPTGERLLTKGSGFKFPHHRGIFLGFSKIGFEGKTYDRWHMKGGDQIVRSLRTVTSDSRRPELIAQIEWEAERGTPLLNEERRFAFSAAPEPFYLSIEIDSSLRTAKGEATLDGDPEHAGAQFRPSEQIDPTKTVYLFPGENVDAHKERDLPWAGEIFTVGGKTFTAVILNHPDNPRGTAFSAYRDYGRFGAFPKGMATTDKPLILRYKWLVAVGEVRDAAAIQAQWNAYAGKNEPVPALTVRAAEMSKPAPPKQPKPAKPAKPA